MTLRELAQMLFMVAMVRTFDLWRPVRYPLGACLASWVMLGTLAIAAGIVSYFQWRKDVRRVPIATGSALDAIAANHGVIRIVESDADLRSRLHRVLRGGAR